MENTVLIQAGKTTAVRFELDGIIGMDTTGMTVPEILKEIQGVRPYGILHPVFQRNLLKLDSNLPFIYAGLVYMYYRKKEKEHSLEKLIKRLREENAMGFLEEWIYEEKLQKLLVETAYGMSAEADWDGGSGQIVKSITLEKNGSYHRFLGNEKEAFGHFLIENCQVNGVKQENSMGTVYEIGGKSYINLSLDIIF